MATVSKPRMITVKRLVWLALALILATAGFPALAQWDGGPGTGPGGVGSTDGASILELWLRADRGVFRDSVCTTALNNDDTAACWADQSGNGADVIQDRVDIRPIFQQPVLNGYPVVRFDGYDDYLSRAAFQMFAAGNSSLAVILVFQSTDLSEERFLLSQPQTDCLNDFELGYTTGEPSQGDTFTPAYNSL